MSEFDINAAMSIIDSMSLNVSLTPQLEEFVKAKVKSGRYLSSSEVVREGLRLLDERDRLADERLSALKREIALGIEQADRGEVSPLDLDEIFEEVRSQVQAHKKKNT
jgi:antitoxin ParD1/3/4